ncbi:hypothetical protein HYS47_02150 [Candidatus Woesearchaeota archaeon]|nr:hypothetical protein [Candidatus Woesearchaeota archaeon]
MTTNMRYGILAALVAGVVGGCSDTEWSPPPVTSPLAAQMSITDWVDEQLKHYQTYGSCHISRRYSSMIYRIPTMWYMDCTMRSIAVEEDPVKAAIYRLTLRAVEGLENEPLRYFEITIGELVLGNQNGKEEKDKTVRNVASISCVASSESEESDPRDKSSLSCKTQPIVRLPYWHYYRYGVSQAVLSSLEARMKAQERKMRR